MPAKPVPGLGLVVGVIAGYAGIVGVSYATTQLVQRRVIQLESDLPSSASWLALLLAVAVVLGVLMAVPAIGAGVMTGTGGLLTIVGLASMLLPARQAFDLSKLFEMPGTRVVSYMLFDGSFFVFGFMLFVVGVRRWVVDAKVARLLTAQAPGHGYHQATRGAAAAVGRLPGPAGVSGPAATTGPPRTAATTRLGSGCGSCGDAAYVRPR
jgi:hypothetical protein